MGYTDDLEKDNFHKPSLFKKAIRFFKPRLQLEEFKEVKEEEHDVWEGVHYAECIKSETGIRSGQKIVKGKEYRIIGWFKREVLYLEGFEWGWGVEYFKPSSKKPDAITCTIGIDVDDALSGTHTISLKYHVSFSTKEELDKLEVAYHIEKCLQDYLNKYMPHEKQKHKSQR